MKFEIFPFALTCAIFWGIAIFLGTWWIIAFDGAQEGATMLGQIYRGYAITPVGSIIGLAWGFADGLIGGAIFAWLYNKLVGMRQA